jgi:hypothetical protein
LPRQASEQYFTSAQLAAHFLRQVKGRPQVTQVFTGKSCGLRKPDLGFFSTITLLSAFAEMLRWYKHWA